MTYIGDLEFRDSERYGIELASGIARRFREAWGEGHYRGAVPIGPEFAFDEGPHLFSGRHGVGALHIALDTNLLIDYFDHGMSMWENKSMPELIGDEHGDELEGFQIVLALAVFRDIRFHVLNGTLRDSKSKPLSPERRRRRSRAWDEFWSAMDLLGNEDETRAQSLILPRSLLDEALLKVPKGLDRQLVMEAVLGNIHVFMTRDGNILKAREALRPFGLLIASPQDMLEELGVAGSLMCLLDPNRCLYWPMPDQQRIAHWIRALPEQAGPSASPPI